MRFRSHRRNWRTHLLSFVQRSDATRSHKQNNSDASAALGGDRTYNRRSILQKMAILPALASVPAWLVSQTAYADDQCNGQTPKAALQYQDKPKGNHRCDNCMQFCPGPKPSAMGTCKIVKGSISPKGWCSAWTPKS